MMDVQKALLSLLVITLVVIFPQEIIEYSQKGYYFTVQQFNRLIDHVEDLTNQS